MACTDAAYAVHTRRQALIQRVQPTCDARVPLACDAQYCGNRVQLIRDVRVSLTCDVQRAETVCLCVCVCVSVSVCPCARVPVCVCPCVSVCPSVSVCFRVCIRVSVCARVSVCPCVRVSVCAVCPCVCVQHCTVEALPLTIVAGEEFAFFIQVRVLSCFARVAHPCCAMQELGNAKQMLRRNRVAK
eukprot:1449507-Rhodomonas_salina.4